MVVSQNCILPNGRCSKALSLLMDAWHINALQGLQRAQRPENFLLKIYLEEMKDEAKEISDHGRAIIRKCRACNAAGLL
jgi:hypothetical protein